MILNCFYFRIVIVFILFLEQQKKFHWLIKQGHKVCQEYLSKKKGIPKVQGTQKDDLCILNSSNNDLYMERKAVKTNNGNPIT
jgi:hypothetical protein